MDLCGSFVYSQENDGLIMKNLEENARMITDSLLAQKLHWNDIISRDSFNHFSGNFEQLIDKYSAKGFVDLLSDGEVNKSFLKWLKDWADNQLTYTSTISSEQNGTQFKNVCLIGGPPGCGKSTLVRICSRHCGYATVELNSSDTGRAKDFNTTVKDVCGSESVLGRLEKKRLLLIEEVDAGDDPTGFIETIAATIDKSKVDIKRPIIFICDGEQLYSKMMKPLREKSLVLKVDLPKSTRLQERIKEVCRKEGISIDSLTVSRFVEFCGNDIRVCLNQLQTILTESGGERKKHLSISDVIKFFSEVDKKGNFLSGRGGEEEEIFSQVFMPKRARHKNHIQNLVGLVSDKSVDLELLSSLICLVPFTDSSMQLVAKSMEMMSFSINSLASEMLPVLYTAISCPCVGQLRLEYFETKKSLREINSIKFEKQGIFSKLRRAKTSMVTRQWRRTDACMELKVLSSFSLVSKKKLSKQDLEFLCGLMKRIGVSLKKDDDGSSFSFSIEPNLEFLTEKFPLSEKQAVEEEEAFWKNPINFGLCEEIVKVVSSNGEKSLVSKLSVSLASSNNPLFSPHRNKSSNRQSFGKKTPQTASEKKCRKFEAINIRDWCHGGDLKKSKNDMEISNFPENSRRCLFEFHFEEGHSNAIKRPVFMREFVLRQ